MSIHKSQGQTLERVKVDLGRVFERGQAYVALSRATSLQGLQVLNFNPDKVRVAPCGLVFIYHPSLAARRFYLFLHPFVLWLLSYGVMQNLRCTFRFSCMIRSSSGTVVSRLSEGMKSEIDVYSRERRQTTWVR